MAVDGLWEVTTHALLQNQQVNNVFYYIRDSVAVPNAGIPEINLAEYFEDTVVPQLKLATSVGIDYRRVTVREILPGFGFDEVIFPENNTGAIPGEHFPVFTAAELYSPRRVGNIRAGFKRFAGIGEGSATNGALIPTSLAIWQTLADDLNAWVPIIEGATEVGLLKPVIVKRIKFTNDQGRVSYRLPETLAELEYAATAYTPRENLTTQNSRKIGRGI